MHADGYRGSQPLRVQDQYEVGFSVGDLISWTFSGLERQQRGVSSRRGEFSAVHMKVGFPVSGSERVSRPCARAPRCAAAVVKTAAHWLTALQAVVDGFAGSRPHDPTVRLRFAGCAALLFPSHSPRVEVRAWQT
jgi:hypothetical protein